MSRTVELSSCLLLLAASSLGAEPGDGTLRLLSRSVERCGSEVGTCLRVRALGLLERALRTGPLRLNDYLTLAPEGPLEGLKQGRALTEEDILAGLPKEEDAREAALDGMIADRMTDFMKSRSIKIRLFSDEEDNSVTDEGRGKKDKKGYGLVIGAFFAMMLKMALAGLALLAFKALMVSKLALVLAAILGLKKLVSGGGESHQVVYATGGHEGGGGGHGGDWGRSDHLAYSAHARSFPGSDALRQRHPEQTR